jgi:hypothetical protein
LVPGDLGNRSSCSNGMPSSKSIHNVRWVRERAEP